MIIIAIDVIKAEHLAMSKTKRGFIIDFLNDAIFDLNSIKIPETNKSFSVLYKHSYFFF